MKRRSFLSLGVAALVAACGPRVPATGPGGVPVFRITSREADRIPERMRDALNSYRAAGGLAPVSLDPRLSQAAEAHARDMSRQNRPWLWGSDASSPIDRAVRAGYTQPFVGEVISESFESDIATLDAWMATPETRVILMDPSARAMGIGWFQEPGGKIWWSLNLGGGSGAFALADA